MQAAQRDNVHDPLFLATIRASGLTGSVACNGFFSRVNNGTEPTSGMLVVTTHKWGYVDTMEWCHRPGCIFRGFFPTTHRAAETYRADVIVARNVFQAIASGYAYHKKGAECWLDHEFKPNPYPSGGNDHLRHSDWWTKLNLTKTETKPYAHIRNFCEVLVALPERIGLSVYAEFAHHIWYADALRYLTLHPNTTIRCLEGSSQGRRLNKQSHSSHEDATSRARHVGIIVEFDHSSFGGRYRKLQEYTAC